MHLGTKASATLCLVVLGVLLVAPTAAASTITVTSNPYSTGGTITVTEMWDSYEFTAANGAKVTYTVTPSGSGCVMVFFVKGHAVTLDSTYFTGYSQATCGVSYSNTFPVASSDGTAFSLLVATTATTDVPYTVQINVQPPTAADLVIPILVIAVLIAVPVLAILLLRRRKKTPSVPPPYMPTMMPPPAYAGPVSPLPAQPPEQPPIEPGIRP